MPTVVFCPKCGDRLPEMNGRWCCPRGGMELSSALAEALLDVYIRQTRPPAARPLSFQVGGSWYCPACGSTLTEQNGLLACNRCGRGPLNEFIHPLVELCPHS